MRWSDIDKIIMGIIFTLSSAGLFYVNLDLWLESLLPQYSPGFGIWVIIPKYRYIVGMCASTGFFSGNLYNTFAHYEKALIRGEDSL